MSRPEVKLYGEEVSALADAVTSGMVKPDAQWEDFIFEPSVDDSDDVVGDYWPPIKGLSEVDNLRQPPNYRSAWLAKHE